MGQTKRRIDRETEYGYTSIDSRVCNLCVSDKHIKQFIKEIGEESKCDYCKKNRAKTVDFNGFIEYFLKYVDTEYSNPLEVFVNFDDGETFGIFELLDNCDIDLTEQESLRNHVIDSLSDREWCKVPYYHYEESDALKAGWEKFAEVAKKFRFTYQQHDDEHFDEPIRPSAFLEALSYVISQVGLYKRLSKGTFLYRVRIHNKKEKLTTASELAVPPADRAIYPNRMSPSGVPMFYGTFDIGTAIKETYSVKYGEQIATVAKFKLLQDIDLVDLGKIPPYLGFFEEANYSNHQIEFLNDFVTAISAPIDKDGREHIDYVPTQIITEHLRYVHHKSYENEQIHGLIYPSSKLNGKKSVVIFCENEHCVEKGEAKKDSFFELESLKRVNPKNYI